jgi:flagellar biosynthetic protein FliQ
MSQEFVIGLGHEALWTALKIGAPVLVASLVVGIVISAVQAMTQINDASLAFVPKVVAVVAALAFFGPWMLTSLVEYAMRLFAALPMVAR